MMRVAKELPNSSTLSNLGSTALYLIATLPDEEKRGLKSQNMTLDF
ncbi:hypothetical protein Si039_00824 [Streptococcus infantarius subsp. infantarius]|nr:hypothetical protein [Streptococcus infantarius subsp. infantarius]MCO4625068.1 hypothetical protein [Streptococcus infantarius subsp. infantarius]MCO4628568.1 hypothetical protein [Streptococcus infantarius subsp. infantarius]MCO4632473.1 hypothetical protein [Streptococcus infantarius subsp. infantarius]MCO4633893.1 hypothetical protein [Streptococcus infantarius subsp. infantarius]